MIRGFLKLAVVEDDKGSKKRFQKTIKESNLVAGMIFFRQSNELLEYIDGPQNHVPDIIFLKLDPMIKNFHKNLRQIRRQQQLRNTPIVVYSIGASEQLIEDIFVYGANVYMEKPPSYEKFREVVERILKISFQYLESNLNIENFIYRT